MTRTRYASTCLAALLAGCATFEAPPYWIPLDLPPVPVRQILYKDVVFCESNKPVWGCSDRRTGIITISRAAPAMMHACIVSHERTHLAGYGHLWGKLGGVWCDLHTFMPTPHHEG